MTSVSVVDYGVGNVGSVANMLRHIGSETQFVSTPQEVLDAQRLLLPGVGSFDHGMSELTSRGLAPALQEAAKAGTPLLGICLGMQLLTRGSQEGVANGLSFVEAHCERLSPLSDDVAFKVPHMGWNTVIPDPASLLLADLEDDSRFYFVHSYHVVCDSPNDVAGTTWYRGRQFTSALEHGGNVFGAQFHPEKSHRYGMALLRTFSGL